MEIEEFVFTHIISCKQLIGKRVDVLKTMLKDIMSECLYRSPSLVILDDFDTLCYRPQDNTNMDENYLSSLSELFCQMILSENGLAGVIATVTQVWYSEC